MTNSWRLPLARRLRFEPASTTSSSSGAGSLGDTVARSLESSGVYKLQQGHPVERVIARALSSAGLTSASAPSHTVDSLLGQHGMRVQRSPGMQTRQSVLQRASPAALPGQFLDGSYSNEAGTRAYKLYVPANRAAGDALMPLVVMLHGCTQSPDDFAVGTQMNRLAERDGFLVLYPAQSANANGSNCWNWFRAEDQQRERGEPFLIAGLTRKIASSPGVYRARVCVAGLSAGAAMAVILGATYPDVFAAVGAHSGLAYGSAHDMPSAFAAMKGGGSAGKRNLSGVIHADATSARARPRKAVPTIVFHGDHDSTVHIENDAEIVDQALEAHRREKNLRAPQSTQMTSGNRLCSRTTYADASNSPVVEHWILHGAGHAWSGGNACGSYTDAWICFRRNDPLFPFAGTDQRRMMA
jgi:poly(hydroxyalkanoate) depolymerase family esterase